MTCGFGSRVLVTKESNGLVSAVTPNTRHGLPRIRSASQSSPGHRERDRPHPVRLVGEIFSPVQDELLRRTLRRGCSLRSQKKLRNRIANG